MIPYFPQLSFHSDGRREAKPFKVWRYPDGSLMWDVLPAMKELCPRRTFEKESFRVNKLLEQDFKDWKAWLVDGGTDYTAHVVSSQTAAEAKKERLTERHRGRFSISTLALPSLCIWGAAWRVVKVNKVAAKSLLEAVLGSCLPNVGYSQLPLSEMIQDNYHLCGQHAGGRCLHVQDVMAAVGKKQTDGEKLFVFIYEASLWSACPTLKASLLEAIESLAAGVEEEWTDRSFPTDSVRHAELHVGSKRKGRMDEDLKKEICKRVANRKVSAESTAALALQGGRVCKALAAGHYHGVHGCMLEVLEHLPLDGVYSVCYDASRLGSPLEETILYALTDGEKAVWLAPQVATNGCVCWG